MAGRFPRWFLRRVFRRIRHGCFDVTYWDGLAERYGDGPPSLRLVFRRPLPVGRFVADPVLAFGEAYMDGAIDVEGDLGEVIRLAKLNEGVLPDSGRSGALATRAAYIRRRSASLAGQKRDVQQHYDLGNDFFSRWLDETMSYSCAYFRTPGDDITQAQLQKIDHVLAKLQLRPGERLLDIGSGWGWLMVRAVQLYGVSAFGVTLSEEQYRETRRRIEAAGLGGRVDVALLDYRTLAAQGRTFDKIASVGMFEHVGASNHRAFLRAVRRMLVPGGLMLLHTITAPTEGPSNSWMQKYIFPGGAIPSLRQVIRLLPEEDLHVLDVESLRMHYALTLDRWAERFEADADWVGRAYGERFFRMWRLYLRGSAASFRHTGLDIHQILLSNGLNNALPLTRDHLYRSVGLPGGAASSLPSSGMPGPG